MSLSHEGAPQGTVAVVGLGKIGLPLAIQYVRHGYRVIGCDVAERVVEGINAGHCHVGEEAGLDGAVAEAVAAGMLRATQDTTEGVRQADVVVVIVPVVVHGEGEVAFAAIDAATEAVGAGLRRGTLVIYETTLPVGTTAGRFRRMLERGSALSADGDFLLAYSPERVSSGHIFRDLATYPKVVGGVSPESTRAAVTFYRSVLEADIIEMASTQEAEFVKLIETTYRDVNIALANEFAQFADTHALDFAAAARAANSQPYSHIHQAGIGVGGHCIPVYPYFLMQGATEGLSLVRRSRAINDGMAEYAVDRLEAVVGSLAGTAVLLLGVAYRGDVRETAFTSARLVQQALAARGARVYVDDPLYTDEELTGMGYTPLPSASAARIDAIILQADHHAYHELDWSRFPNCRVVLDGRSALSREVIESRGMRYICIGDGKSADPGEAGGAMAAPSATANRGTPPAVSARTRRG